MKAIINNKMMNRKLLTGLFIAAGFLFNACQKDIDVFVPDAGQLNSPDTSWYSTITATMPVTAVRNSLSLPTYTDSIQVNNSNAYITTPFGLLIGFPPNCCSGNAGQVITGTVQVELMLIKKRGDMIRMNKTTTSNGRLLVSGGEIFVSLKKEGVAVQLKQGVRIQIRQVETAPSTLMRFFAGDESNAERFNWLPTTDTLNTLVIGTQGYEIMTNHLRWINCDHFFDTTGTSQITVTADLASYFTNANTIAYTVFKDLRSVVGMYGDPATRKFATGRVPAGKAVTVVVISKQGNDYFLGYENTTTASPTSGTPVQHVTVKPVIKSLPDILNFLNTL